MRFRRLGVFVVVLVTASVVGTCAAAGSAASGVPWRLIGPVVGGHGLSGVAQETRHVAGDTEPVPLETLKIEATQTSVVTGETSLEADKKYRIVVTGVTSEWGDQVGVIDALYCFRSVRCEDEGPPPVLRPNLRINGSALDEFAGFLAGGLPYQSSHRYEVSVTGVSGALELSYSDGNHSDNSGSYTVELSLADGQEETCDEALAAEGLLGVKPSNGGKLIIRTDAAERISGTPGDDIICGLAGDDEIFGKGGDDLILGGSGNDVIAGGSGEDLLFGGPGSDTLIGGILDRVGGGPVEGDRFSGGAGRDTVSYTQRSNNVQVTLDGGANDGELREGDNVLRDVEDVIGGTGDDVLVGNNRANRLYGNIGDDTILAGGGNDTLIGGLGNDDLTGEGGRDIFRGGPDDDCVEARDRRRDRTIRGDRGTDTIASYDRSDRRRLRSFEIPRKKPGSRRGAC